MYKLTSTCFVHVHACLVRVHTCTCTFTFTWVWSYIVHAKCMSVIWVCAGLKMLIQLFCGESKVSVAGETLLEPLGISVSLPQTWLPTCSHD